jgi:hypothetical protein
MNKLYSIPGSVENSKFFEAMKGLFNDWADNYEEQARKVNSEMKSFFKYNTLEHEKLRDLYRT